MATNNSLNTVPTNVRETIVYFLQADDVQDLNISPDDVHHYLGVCQCIPGLDKLKHKCQGILLSSLDIHSAIYMMCLSFDYNLQDLKRGSMSVISEHLQLFLTEPSFTTLNAEQMIEIIDLRIKMFGDSDICYRAAITWLEVEPVHRKDDFQKMLDFIGHKNGPTKKPQISLRRKEYQYQLLFSTLWKKNKCKLTVQVYDITYNKAYQSDCKNESGYPIDISANYAVCCHQLQHDNSNPPYIIVTGGADTLHRRRTLVCDLISSKWKIKRHMEYSRQNHFLCSANNRVYSIGGYSKADNYIELVRQVEEFDLTANTWRVVACLPLPVYSCTCVAFENLIYIIGGKDKHDNDVTAVQVFDIDKHKITVATNLPFSVSGGQAEVMDGKIYFAANNGKFLRINPSTFDTTGLAWQLRTSRNLIMSAGDRCLVVSCCEDEPSVIYSYDVSANTWTRYRDWVHNDSSVYGKNIVTYPFDCKHIPFCD